MGPPPGPPVASVTTTLTRRASRSLVGSHSTTLTPGSNAWRMDASRPRENSTHSPPTRSAHRPSRSKLAAAPRLVRTTRLSTSPGPSSARAGAAPRIAASPTARTAALNSSTGWRGACGEAGGSNAWELQDRSGGGGPAGTRRTGRSRPRGPGEPQRLAIRRRGEKLPEGPAPRQTPRGASSGVVYATHVVRIGGERAGVRRGAIVGVDGVWNPGSIG